MCWLPREGDFHRGVRAAAQGLGERGFLSGIDGEPPPGLIRYPVRGVLAAVALGRLQPGGGVLVGLGPVARRRHPDQRAGVAQVVRYLGFSILC